MRRPTPAETVRTSQVFSETPSRPAAASAWPFSRSESRSVTRAEVSSSPGGDAGSSPTNVSWTSPAAQADVDPPVRQLCGELHRRLLQGVEEVHPHRGLDGACEPVRRLDDRLIPERGGCGEVGPQPVDES